MQYGLQEFFRHPKDVKGAGLSGDLDGKTAVVQGLGNVGYHAAKFLSEEDGVRVIAVIERDGAVVSDKGLNIEELSAYRLEKGGLRGFPGVDYVENGRALLEAECDLLIPAALENQITVENAARVKAKLIAETANGPVTYGADEILRSRGAVILPDFFLNAGGVTVSYFEWIKNLSHIRFGRLDRRFEEMRGRQIADVIEAVSGKSVPAALRAQLMHGASELDLVRSGLDDTMREAYQQISKVLHENDDVPDLRTAGFVVSIGKIAQSYKEMGL